MEDDVNKKKVTFQITVFVRMMLLDEIVFNRGEDTNLDIAFTRVYETTVDLH